MICLHILLPSAYKYSREYEREEGLDTLWGQNFALLIKYPGGNGSCTVFSISNTYSAVRLSTNVHLHGSVCSEVGNMDSKNCYLQFVLKQSLGAAIFNFRIFCNFCKKDYITTNLFTIKQFQTMITDDIYIIFCLLHGLKNFSFRNKNKKIFFIYFCLKSGTKKLWICWHYWLSVKDILSSNYNLF